MILNRRFDPPHRISGEACLVIGIEALERLDQAEAPLVNQVRAREPGCPIALGYADHQTHVTGHQPRHRVTVATQSPACQPPFLIARQHRRAARRPEQGAFRVKIDNFVAHGNKHCRDVPGVNIIVVEIIFVEPWR